MVCDVSDKNKGINQVCKALDIQCLAEGFPVYAKQGEAGELFLSKKNGEYEIRYGSVTQLYRALGYIKEHENESEYKISENARFDTNGIMLDVSQSNAALKPEYLEMFLDRMAIMGLNTLYLYMEDSFHIPEEPYFGHMRGRYTRDELKALDDYAYELGITVIPCVQTLAHLSDVLKWPVYASIREDADVLLVGDERVYEFIKNLLFEMRSTFRSKHIHIGMDEAWRLGRGSYLDRNGYHPLFEIMQEHLHRVLKICDELGIEPMVWSDMLINASHGKGTGMANYYNTDHEILPESVDAFPRDLIQVYWDYNHHTVSKYEKIIKRHKELTDQVVFAGGIWNWNGFTVDYDKTFLITVPALNACKKCGIKNVFATTWGDGGTESNIFGILLGMQLYAEYGYSDHVSEETLAKRFYTCTGCNYHDFRNMTYIDNLIGQEPQEGYCYSNRSRIIMWQDILIGQFDKHLEGGCLAKQYDGVYKDMQDATKRNGQFVFVFEFLEKVTNVLRLKVDMGIRIKEYYDQGDRYKLRKIVSCDLQELSERVRALYDYHRKLWFKCNKSFGWDILDARYGSILLRIDTAIMRLEDYLNGVVKELTEISEPRLPYNGAAEFPMVNRYDLIYSSSRLS